MTTPARKGVWGLVQRNFSTRGAARSDRAVREEWYYPTSEPYDVSEKEQRPRPDMGTPRIDWRYWFVYEADRLGRAQ